MNIAFVTTQRYVPEGGSEQLWLEAAHTALVQGHQLWIAAYDSAPGPGRLAALIDGGAGYHPLPFSDQEPTDAWSSLAAFRPDRILVNNARGFECMRLSRLVDLFCGGLAPYLLINHGEGLPPADQYEATRRVYRTAAGVGFCSDQNRRQAEQALGVEFSNAFTLRNPVNLRTREYLPPPPQTEAIRLACVSRLHLAKGHATLLAALARPEHAHHPWTLSLVGEGEHRSEMEQIIQENGLGHRVFFTGSTHDMVELWRQHHAFVLASPSEGVPLSMVEAMICGRPVVVTDVGGISEWVRDGVDGYIAPDATADAFSQTLARAFRDRMDWTAMGYRAHGHAMARVPDNAGKDLLDQVLSAGPASRAAGIFARFASSFMPWRTSSAMARSVSNRATSSSRSQ